MKSGFTKELWESVRLVFEPRVVWNDEDLKWTAVCWGCQLYESFMIKRDADYYLKGHTVSSAHKSNKALNKI